MFGRKRVYVYHVAYFSKTAAGKQVIGSCSATRTCRIQEYEDILEISRLIQEDYNKNASDPIPKPVSIIFYKEVK